MVIYEGSMDDNGMDGAEFTADTETLAGIAYPEHMEGPFWSAAEMQLCSYCGNVIRGIVSYLAVVM